jgi:hydrogenase expression/formation protein HypE
MNNSTDPHVVFGCPISTKVDDCVQLAHGEGGRLMRQLIQQRIIAGLGAVSAGDMEDATLLDRIDGSLAITTDSYVVTPRFFPGGDIGSMAVYGTVNDLAVRGAEPLWLTLALIIEEGLPLAELSRIIDSVANAARRCGVKIVAGDTKVVPRGAADGLFINTTGIGRMREPWPVGSAGIQVGDALVVSGPIGQHGIAVLSAREDLGFDPLPISDSAPLMHTTQALQQALGEHLRAMRDATRGGVAAVLHEWAEASGNSMQVEEKSIKTTAIVRGVCELLGLDPLYIANEGTLVVAVSGAHVDATLSLLQSIDAHRDAAILGTVTERTISAVCVKRMLGRLQPLDEPLGAPLPRIC